MVISICIPGRYLASAICQNQNIDNIFLFCSECSDVGRLQSTANEYRGVHVNVPNPI